MVPINENVPNGREIKIKQGDYMKKMKPIPFDFVLEQLYSVHPIVRPMFGCYAVYAQHKIVLILRDKADFRHDNGVWLATNYEHHEALRKDFPSMRSIKLFGGKESGWQNLPSDALDFEEAVMKACGLILRGDQRIGKEPEPRRRKRRL
jgi:hypothetical protein